VIVGEGSDSVCVASESVAAIENIPSTGGTERERVSGLVMPQVLVVKRVVPLL
jgi:hypothetical protein